MAFDHLPAICECPFRQFVLFHAADLPEDARAPINYTRRRVPVLCCRMELAIVRPSRSLLCAIRPRQTGKHWEVLEVERHQSKSMRFRRGRDQSVYGIRTMTRSVTPDVLAGEACDGEANVANDKMRQQSVNFAPLSGVSASGDKLRSRYRANRRRPGKAGEKRSRCSLPAQYI